MEDQGVTGRQPCQATGPTIQTDPPRRVFCGQWEREVRDPGEKTNRAMLGDAISQVVKKGRGRIRGSNQTKGGRRSVYNHTRKRQGQTATTQPTVTEGEGPPGARLRATSGRIVGHIPGAATRSGPEQTN